jgi:AcrR family transcriptional regulator
MRLISSFAGTLGRPINRGGAAPQFWMPPLKYLPTVASTAHRTQHIADVLGIRQASLYYYFPSKEVALEEVCLRGVEGFLERAGAIAGASGSVREKIERLMRAHLTPLTDRRAYVRTFLNERQHLPIDSRRRIGRLSRAYERLIEDVLKSGCTRWRVSTRSRLPPRHPCLPCDDQWKQ